MTIGAVRVWRKVELNKPLYLVLPLTVEPSKPLLCLDARFFNLWMKDGPFSLELVDVTSTETCILQNAIISRDTIMSCWRNPHSSFLDLMGRMVVRLYNVAVRMERISIYLPHYWSGGVQLFKVVWGSLFIVHR